MKYYLALILATILFACNSPQGQKKVQSHDSVKPKQSTSESNDDTRVVFKGLYTFGNEVNTFRDCVTNKKYWVNDSLGLMKIPYQNALQSFSYPYESAYAEVKGYLSGKSDLGYASEHENVLVVTEVVKMEAKNFRTECYNYEFIAIGNEPFWSVDIIPNEELIVLKDVGKDKVYRFPYKPANRNGKLMLYQTSNDLNDTLTITIREESCSDGMSDNAYSYFAEVNINGKLLKGCAIKKGDKIRQNE